jgi:hypothetical protein
MMYGHDDMEAGKGSSLTGVMGRGPASHGSQWSSVPEGGGEVGRGGAETVTLWVLERW